MRTFLFLALLSFFALPYGAQAQFVLTDQESGKEVLFLPLQHPQPEGLTLMGKARTRGSTGLDQNAQLEKLAVKALKKNANVVRVTDFYFEPGRIARECGIEGELYASANFDSLKRVSLKEASLPNPGHSPVVFYRPAFEDKFTKDFNYTLKVDSVRLEMTLYSIYTLQLRNDSTYFIKVPDQGIIKLKVKPGTITYVRCSTFFNDKAPPPPVFGAGASANLFFPGKGTLMPRAEVMSNANMCELEISSLKNLRP